MSQPNQNQTPPQNSPDDSVFPGKDIDVDRGFASLRELRRRLQDGTIREILDDWKWIFSYTARYKKAVLFYLFLGLFSTFAGQLSAYLNISIVDIITGHQSERLWVLITVSVVSMLLSLTLGKYLGRVSTKISIDIHNDIQADVFGRILGADWLSISRYPSGDVLNRFNSDASSVSSNAIVWIPQVVVAFVNFGITLFIMWRIDVTLALLAFAGAPFLLLASRIVLKKQREYQKKVKEMSSAVRAFEVETFGSMDTIKSFGVSGICTQKLKGWQALFRRMQLDYNLFSIKTDIYLQLVGYAVGSVCFFYCLFRMWDGRITFGEMTYFLTRRSALSGAFSSIVSILPAFLSSSVSAHRVRELMELPREADLPLPPELSTPENQVVRGTGSLTTPLATSEDLPLPQEPADNSVDRGTGSLTTPLSTSEDDSLLRKSADNAYGANNSNNPDNAYGAGGAYDAGGTSQGLTVELKDVDFSYREGVPVVNGGSLTARPGEIIGLVGPSGEGKTTLIRLILGLLQPDRGHVRLRTAHSAADVSAGTRSLFSYVPQGNTLLSGTVAENLRLVKPDATEAELTEALRLACALDFVRQLPEGMETPLGEHGRVLSEGQAQRLAIARALLRNSPVLLLDEATSALDVPTERQVLRSLAQQCPNRTVILVTHRPTALSLCTRVYRILDTKLTELPSEEAARMAMDF